MEFSTGKRGWFLCIGVLSCLLSGAMIDRKRETPVDLQDGDRDSIDLMVAFAQTQLNKPYAYGGKGPGRFDCSGFTGYVFSHFNRKLPASSHLQSQMGEPVARDQLQPGDLIFFLGPSGGERIGHVGIVTEVTDESVQFIHSSSGRGITIDDLMQSEHYQQRYVTARRVM